MTSAMTALLALLLLASCASGDRDLVRNRDGECFLVSDQGFGLRCVSPMDAAACTFTDDESAVFGSRDDAEQCALARVSEAFACAPLGEETDGP